MREDNVQKNNNVKVDIYQNVVIVIKRNAKNDGNR